MLIFATLALNVVAISIWSLLNKANGFTEVGKMLRGEPAFVSVSKFDQAAKGGGGVLTGTTEGIDASDGGGGDIGGGGGAW